MPKNVYKIDRFEGGINDESDAKDLEKNEVEELENEVRSLENTLAVFEVDDD